MVKQGQKLFFKVSSATTLSLHKRASSRAHRMGFRYASAWSHKQDVPRVIAELRWRSRTVVPEVDESTRTPVYTRGGAGQGYSR